MSRPTLTAPFRVVEKVNGMDYVPISEVIDRLNTVLGTGKWSFTCEAFRDQHDPDFVIAKGQFTVDVTNDAGVSACIIEQYGGQKINRKTSGEIIDLGNDYKGAASDALKKCCQHIGVALYLALGHPPMMAAQFGEGKQQEGGANEASGDTTSTSSGTGGGAGERASASTTPGGEPF